MLNFSQLFKKKTAQESNAELIEKAQAKGELEELQNLGKMMLADARYDKYRQVFNEMLGKAIRTLIEYKCVDNNTYATNVRSIIIQIRDMLNFLDTPKSFLNYVEMQVLSGEKKKEVE